MHSSIAQFMEGMESECHADELADDPKSMCRILQRGLRWLQVIAVTSCYLKAAMLARHGCYEPDHERKKRQPHG